MHGLRPPDNWDPVNQNRTLINIIPTSPTKLEEEILEYVPSVKVLLSTADVGSIGSVVICTVNRLSILLAKATKMKTVVYHSSSICTSV